MEKAKFKKNIHFTNEEEIFVAKMISDGADYNNSKFKKKNIFG